MVILITQINKWQLILAYRQLKQIILLDELNLPARLISLYAHIMGNTNIFIGLNVTKP